MKSTERYFHVVQVDYAVDLTFESVDEIYSVKI